MTDFSLSSAKRLRLSAPYEQQLAFPLPEAEDDKAKTDIIGYFAQRGSRALDSERENQKLKAELARLESSNQAAQQEINLLKEGTRAQTQDAELHKKWFSEERKQADEQLKKEMANTADALAKLDGARKAQAVAAERAEKAEADLAHARAGFQKEAVTVQLRLQRLESDLRAAKLDVKMAKGRQSPQSLPIVSEEIRELKARNETLETAVADDSKQRGILEVRLAEETQERQRLGLALKNAQSEGSTSNQDVINALRSELKAQDTEIAEARKIKSRVKSLAILQEKLRRAEAAAARAEQVQSNEAKLEDKISALELQLQCWESSGAELGYDNPEGVATKLRGLQNECLGLSEQLATRMAEAKRLQDEVAAVAAQNTKEEADKHRLQGMLNNSLTSTTQLQQKVDLLVLERDGLQRLLASLSKEDAMGPKPGGVQDAVDADMLLRQKALVEALTAQKANIEKKLTETAAEAGGLYSQLADALSKVAELEVEKTGLQRELDSLEERADQMQTRLDKGEFNPATTRVLHFVANPEAEAHKEAQTERISKLEAEVATLKLQTSMTDTSHSSGVSGTAETALAALEARAVITAQKIAELTKREARLKDVFQKQVANFREAVYCLFGYRVDMASESQARDPAQKGDTTFVLKPQFADSSRMQLMFRFHKGRMELVSTEFTERKLKREVETFIERQAPLSSDA